MSAEKEKVFFAGSAKESGELTTVILKMDPGFFTQYVKALEGKETIGSRLEGAMRNDMLSRTAREPIASRAEPPAECLAPAERKRFRVIVTGSHPDVLEETLNSPDLADYQIRHIEHDADNDAVILFELKETK